MAKFRIGIQPAEQTQEAAPKKNKFTIGSPKKKDDFISALGRDVQEVPGQAAKGLGQGFGGTYGDILDLFGLQAKETLPGQKSLFETEAKASPVELAAMSDADEPTPRYSRLPSSEEAGEALEKAGLPGEAKTPLGRLAHRGGQFVGGGAAFGQLQAGLPLKAAFAGQTAEELGAPKWLQAILELGTFVKGSKSKNPLSSSSKEVDQELKRLSDIGFSDDDLTLAKNALEDRGWLKKTSKFTPEAEQKFNSSVKNSEQHVEDILEQSFPTITKTGTSQFKEKAEQLFDGLDSLAQEVVIENPASFQKNAKSAIKDLKATLANTPEEKEVIGILNKAVEASKGKIPASVQDKVNKAKELIKDKPEKAGFEKFLNKILEDSREKPTGNFYTAFYRGLNRIGKWGNPRQRERVFTTVKNSVKDTFNDQGPIGQELAKRLDSANDSWIKYLRAEDVSDLMRTVTTEEGVNFGKLAHMLDNPTHYDVLVKGLGKNQASNLRLIAKTAKSIQGLEKKIKGGQVKDALGAGKAFALAKGVFTGDFKSLKAYVGAESLGRIAAKFLTDPKYQNLQLRLLDAIKDKKYDLIRTIAIEMEKDIPTKDQSKKSKQPVRRQV